LLLLIYLYKTHIALIGDPLVALQGFTPQVDLIAPRPYLQLDLGNFLKQSISLLGDSH